MPNILETVFARLSQNFQGSLGHHMILCAKYGGDLTTNFGEVVGKLKF